MERIIRCNQLLVQADRMITDFFRIAHSDSPAEQRQHFADTYMDWYAAGQVVMLDELRAYFEKRYTTAIGGFPSIRDLLTWLTDTIESGRGYHYLAVTTTFKLTIDEQCEALRMTRREIFPRLAQIPYNLRFAIATICKRMYYESSLDRLFTDNGCVLTWWIPPLKPVESKRMTRALGWLDGVVLYAPDREITIARAVCEEILRKPQLRPEIREELTCILPQLVPTQAVLQSAAPGDSSTTHHQTLLATHRRRLELLEIQAATFGQNTPPETHMEIDKLRRLIQDLEQTATT